MIDDWKERYEELYRRYIWNMEDLIEAYQQLESARQDLKRANKKIYQLEAENWKLRNRKGIKK